jgi:hypothetical protein
MDLELPMRLLDWIDKDKLDWKGLSANPSPEAIRMLRKNPNKIKFYNLIENISLDAIQILNEHKHNVDWWWYENYWNMYTKHHKKLVLSSEEIQLLRENPDTINWRSSPLNNSPYAIPLLKENQDKIWWHGLSKSPHIFTYDYEKMNNNMLLFREDLMNERFHPRNIPKFRDWGIPWFEDYEDDK